MIRKVFIILLLFITSIATAQVPDTDIYLIRISSAKGKITLDTPVNISNRPGYDNQPLFSQESNKVIYVSMTDTAQTDLMEYDILTGRTKQLISTPESEYSPNYNPSNGSISVVRVDSDKGQRLYEYSKFPSAGGILIDETDSIGYYRWINDSLIAMAVLNNGMELYLFEMKSRQFVIADRDIGRCLMIDPGDGKLIYTKPSEGAVTQLMKADPATAETFQYCEGYKSSQDYVFARDGSLWTGYEGKLLRKDCGSDTDWMEIADLSKSVGPFYRLVISPDGKYLAVVSFTGKLP